jgi:hypothetical protein
MVAKKKTRAKKTSKKVEKKTGDEPKDLFEEMSDNTDKQDKEMNVGKTLRARENRQLIWVFVIIVGVFAIFLGTYFYVQGLKTFEFSGVDWIKEEYRDFDLYHSRFPIIYGGEVVANYNLYLRNDPRENDVPAEVDIGFWSDVVISHEKEAGQCSGAVRVTGDLSMFLGAFPIINNITGAVNDPVVADNLDLEFADCSSAINRTVIMIQKSESPSIVAQGDCYILNIGQCENVETIEKFMIKMVQQLNFKKV